MRSKARRDGFAKYWESRRALVERELARLLPKESDFPPDIHRAMRYCVLSSGAKRMRPVLTLAACEASGGEVRDALACACALEMIHTYSLIHDDLPAMDNAATRRGKPSAHAKFGEAVAILCGDALLTYGFEILARRLSREVSGRVIHEVSRSIGTRGMIGGQAAELALAGRKVSLPALHYVHAHKTGALIAACLKAGGLVGGANQKVVAALGRFGERLGYAFQILDDLEDNEGFVKILKRAEARALAEETVEQGKRWLAPLGARRKLLESLADQILRKATHS